VDQQGFDLAVARAEGRRQSARAEAKSTYDEAMAVGDPEAKATYETAWLAGDFSAARGYQASMNDRADAAIKLYEAALEAADRAYGADLVEAGSRFGVMNGFSGAVKLA
jgi:hypothetical protein